MASTELTCAICRNNFIGRTGASYCSPACRQRAHRSRRGTNRNAKGVTDTAPPAAPASAAGGGHSAAAVELLRALDAELAANGEAIGEALEWSATEQAVLKLIADTIDRKVDLEQRYEASDDDRTRMKLATEVRLLETSLARLLKQVRTDIPAPTSRRSQKAREAANTRWAHAAD